MYFDTQSTSDGEPLLLPDEFCLAEDENGLYTLHCEKIGFHLFHWGDVNSGNISVKIYLTDYRVFFCFMIEVDSS